MRVRTTTSYDLLLRHCRSVARALTLHFSSAPPYSLSLSLCVPLFVPSLLQRSSPARFPVSPLPFLLRFDFRFGFGMRQKSRKLERERERERGVPSRTPHKDKHDGRNNEDSEGTAAE